MKRIVSCFFWTCFFVCMIPVVANAQKNVKVPNNGNIGNTKLKESETLTRTVNDLKTGNWQDVLSSFFQLAVSDLTGESKSLSFKARLYALKLKADSTLLIDTNLVKQKFARNFQFDFALKLDTQYHFKGFQAGFTWALINKRDSIAISFVNTALDRLHITTQKQLQQALADFEQSLVDSTGEIPDDKLPLWNKTKQAVNNLLDKEIVVASSKFPEELQPFFNSEVYDRNVALVDSLFNARLAEMRRKPLLTLSVNTTFANAESAFSNGSAQLVYLQGINTRRTRTEFDIRTLFSVKDTFVVETDRRAWFNATAGINFSLVQTKTGKSVVEFKPYFEYNTIFTKLYGLEEKNLFLANADLRVRIFDKLWLPFTIKYDIDRGKFLGFLDIEFNFDAFKKQ
jgi:hypothetical protein